MIDMNFIALNHEYKESLRPIIARAVASMEGVSSGNRDLAVNNCSVSDNIDSIINFIKGLLLNDIDFDTIQNIDNDDIYIYTNDYLSFELEIYFNGRERNNGFFAVFYVETKDQKEFLRFETIKT